MGWEYLVGLVLSVLLLGYLAQQEKNSREELAAMADVAQQPRVEIGLGGSIVAFARVLSAALSRRAPKRPMTTSRAISASASCPATSRFRQSTIS